MHVEDVMTRDVVTVQAEMSLRAVAALLAEQAISGVPVVSDGQLVGVVSEADVIAKQRGPQQRRGGLLGLIGSNDVAAADLKLDARTAGEAMSTPAITIGPNRPVADAAALMMDEQVNRLPVVDDAGVLIGIVTRADLVRAFVRTDAELAEEIRSDVLLRALWIVPDSVEVEVDEGVVTLTGRVENRETAEILPRYVQRVPGVVAVRSEVTWDEVDDLARHTLTTQRRI